MGKEVTAAGSGEGSCPSCQSFACVPVSALLELSPQALEAGAQTAYEWRTLGGWEGLGSYDLVRRVVETVLAEVQKAHTSKTTPLRSRQKVGAVGRH